MNVNTEYEKTVPYCTIPTGICFEYEEKIYIKTLLYEKDLSENKSYDLDVKSGILYPPCYNDSLVKPLYDATIYTHKIKEE